MPPVAGAIAGGLASGVAGAAVNRLFGGGGGGNLSQARTIPNINAGGLNVASTPTNLTVTPSADRSARVGSVQGLLNQTAKQFANIRAQLRPGFGALTEARVGALNDARFRTIGNLRENLARRRLQGSSFASDTIARAEREFAREEADLRARSFLEEIDATTRFIDRELELSVGAVERGIAELDLEVNLASQLVAGITSQLGANARLEAELAAQSAQGIGAFFQPAIDAVGTAASDFVTGLFSPSQAIDSTLGST